MVYSVFQILLDHVIHGTHDLPVGVLLPYLAILLNLVAKLMADFFRVSRYHVIMGPIFIYIYIYIIYIYIYIYYIYIFIYIYIYIKNILTLCTRTPASFPS